MDNQIAMGALSLRGTHDLINEKVLPLLNDADKVETAMTKTPDGYIWEIRYKSEKPWAGATAALTLEQNG